MRLGLPSSAVVLGLSLFLSSASYGVMTPLLPDIRDDLGVSTTIAGLIVGSYGLARLVVDLPIGPIANRVHTRNLATGAFALQMVASVMGLFATSVGHLVASRLIAGASGAVIISIVLTRLSILADDPSRRGRVMSVFQISNGSAAALHPLMGGIVASALGWRAAFLIPLVASGVAALLIRRVLGSSIRATPPGAPPTLLPDRVEEPSAPSFPSKAVLFALIAGVVAFNMHRHGITNTVLPLRASELGLDTVAISTGFAVIAGTGLLVAVPGALLGDRFGRRRIVFAGLLLAGVADVALLGVQSYPLFLVLCLAMGAADFFSSSQTAMLGDLTSVRHRALVLGIYRFAVDLGAFIGPLVLALLLDARGLEAAILLSSSALIGSAALVRTLYPRPSRRTI